MPHKRVVKPPKIRANAAPATLTAAAVDPLACPLCAGQCKSLCWCPTRHAICSQCGTYWLFPAGGVKRVVAEDRVTFLTLQTRYWKCDRLRKDLLQASARANARRKCPSSRGKGAR